MPAGSIGMRCAARRGILLDCPRAAPFSRFTADLPMPKDTKQKNRLLSLLVYGLLAGIFLIDWITPRGYAEWILYIVPVATCLLIDRPAFPYKVAAISIVLLSVGLYISADAGLVRLHVSELNRGIGALTIWVLAIVASRYATVRLEMQRSNWMQKGQMRLAARLRGEQSAMAIGDNILRVLAEYLDIKIGAVYALDHDILYRIAQWGLTADAGAPVRVGEGLLGQAVAERATVTLDHAPGDYFRMSSGLGSAEPAQVIIVPILADGGVAGAVEIGFLGAQDRLADAREMLERGAEMMGMALRSARYRQRQIELLEETQRQSEELQVQQEELHVSNEELEERGRALMESQARLETQQGELEQTNVALEEHTQRLESQKDDLLRAQRDLAAQKLSLERASQYKSEFLANMSHELRTPLNSSLILAKLLQDNKDGTLTPEQVRYAATIYSSNSDLLSLINDILDLSKVEAGQMEIEFATLSIDAVLQSLRQSFLPMAQQKGLEFVVERLPGTPDRMVSDSQRLQQVLRNLLSNAFKFTETGTVSLTVSPQADDNVRFDVRDTGIGIAAEKLELIFQAFQQADGTTSRRYGGSGLGLSISREFSRLLGGAVAVTSEPGKGSVFSLTLPVSASEGIVTAQLGFGTADSEAPAPPEPLAAPTHRQAPFPVPALPANLPPAAGTAARASIGRINDDRDTRQRGSRVILAIEDDIAFAGILLDLAHELDFDFLHAPDANEGLQLAREVQPSGILLDVGLPDRSGLTVLEWLKHDPLTRHVPIHIVSATDHAETALRLGAIGHTLKPSARDALAAAIRRLEERSVPGTRRVLVVEDDPVLRRSIHALLQSDAVEIVEAGSIAAALRELQHAPVDCVVMDLTLPDGSGDELLERMARTLADSAPPVIVYTGRMLSTDEEQRLRRYSKSIIIKGAKSPERLLDEVTLFLHSVESALPPEQQRMLRAAWQRDDVFENRTILLAEDDVRNIFALSHVIEPLGARLEIARNGREALEALARNPDIDLVLMDVMMPEMDGLTAMSEIRKQPRLQRLPIIALTAKAMASDRDRCLNAGADDYMSKPVDVDKLVSLCRVWLRQR
jgi:signal transduction histidine kinase/DNA-binding response OmpR family regulator